MTPQEINRRIAEACGWTPLPIPVGHGGAPLFSKKEWEDIRPNYHGDLNAMHEAEKTLTEDQRDFYYPRNLGSWVNLNAPIYSTAAQRAEAFLRTIGKWEDGE
jgi:hypothetical protein